MKKSIAVILFSLYGLSQLAGFCCGHYEKLLHTWAGFRQWTLLHVFDEKLTIVTINSNEFLSITHNEDEIVWKGALFDIIHIKQEAGKTILTLERDEHEQKLMKKSAHFHSLLSKKNRSVPAGHTMKNIFQPLFINDNSDEDDAALIIKEKMVLHLVCKPNGITIDGIPRPPEFS